MKVCRLARAESQTKPFWPPLTWYWMALGRYSAHRHTDDAVIVVHNVGQHDNCERIHSHSGAFDRHMCALDTNLYFNFVASESRNPSCAVRTATGLLERAARKPLPTSNTAVNRTCDSFVVG